MGLDVVDEATGAFDGALEGAFVGTFVGDLEGAFAGAFVGDRADIGGFEVVILVPPPHTQQASLATLPKFRYW